jgi:hypothetical protein
MIMRRYRMYRADSQGISARESQPRGARLLLEELLLKIEISFHQKLQRNFISHRERGAGQISPYPSSIPPFMPIPRPHCTSPALGPRASMFPWQQPTDHWRVCLICTVPLNPTIDLISRSLSWLLPLGQTLRQPNDSRLLFKNSRFPFTRRISDLHDQNRSPDLKMANSEFVLFADDGENTRN